MTELGTIYLLHFSAPYPAGRRPQHYIGWTTDLPSRLADHAAGRGAALMTAVAADGLTFQPVLVWEKASRLEERRIKNQANFARLCPICRAAALARHAREERGRRQRLKLQGETE